MAFGIEINRMLPETQTLFSVTLFLALTCLLAWSNRRHRSRCAVRPSGGRDRAPAETV
jgi:hypothetical protein